MNPLQIFGIATLVAPFWLLGVWVVAVIVWHRDVLGHRRVCGDCGAESSSRWSA